MRARERGRTVHKGRAAAHGGYRAICSTRWWRRRRVWLDTYCQMSLSSPVRSSQTRWARNAPPHVEPSRGEHSHSRASAPVQSAEIGALAVMRRALHCTAAHALWLVALQPWRPPRGTFSQEKGFVLRAIAAGSNVQVRVVRARAGRSPPYRNRITVHFQALFFPAPRVAVR